MDLPLILTNFKNVPTALGAGALALAKIHAEVREETGKNFAVAVAALDLRKVAASEEIPVLAQHVDDAQYGASTGKIIPEEVKKAGGWGTLLNHSDYRFSDFTLLGKTISRAKEAGLVTIVCAQDASEGEAIMNAFSPDFIAVEPPELIGGDISVSTAQPELISESVRRIGAGKVFVGAGVKNGADVKVALDLGAVGVLIASGVTKVADPKVALHDLVSQI